ncbi:MAG TPA: bifunctional 2-polyprenyl-6-hydroxyphenol methylase/3-demethylubiquinol 3-O-methyltransferase UbiG [Stellaceae bacterium]|nr:bifunctional 2-polyprenyl-6-hydroxyphenol methylase/3-demethylubiquinol 3-O-methyltransferase UbiG [Stellaceae bacterium]
MKATGETTHSTIDAAEISRFAAHAAGWWDPEGSFQPLHRLNPTRLRFIRDELLAHFKRDPSSLAPFTGLTLCDIGCGGGLISEPMARMGFAVTGIDADGEAVAIARSHAATSGLDIDYRPETGESLAAAGAQFDVVLALELIEHVADPDALLAACATLVKPGGAFIGATLNRTPQAYALAVIGAEYVMRWLPRGTHDWRRFLRPSEFVLGLRRVGLRPTRIKGVRYQLTSGAWSLSDDLSVNYMVMAAKP